jgi:TPP-dependent pyruvate/acetoin dehydrogenase alpha subunit
VFVCENNLYGASTRVDQITRLKQLSSHAAAYGIRGETADGNDVLAVLEVARRAVAECREGKGPVLLELLTYRRTGHSRRDACGYQPKTERDAWFERDPVEIMSRSLARRSDITAADLQQVRECVAQQLAAAVAFAKEQPHPTLAELETDVFA